MSDDAYKHTSNGAKSQLPFSALAISLLRIYILWTAGSSTKYPITNYDLLLPLCATVHVLSEMMSRNEDIHASQNTAVLSSGTTVQPPEHTKERSMARLSSFLNNRKPAVEVVAIAAILRLARDPKDVCSVWFAWNSVLAGLFGGTAQSYMMQRAKEGGRKPSSPEAWIGMVLGLWIAFLA